MTEQRTVNIHVPVLARVEGEGELKLQIEKNSIKQLQLNIFEPPRYFEKFLEGRNPQQVIDTVARICGICPVAYQISAVQALENAFDVEPSPEVTAMRRAFYCGEWIQSHALHIHLLAAPDFLGFDSAISMAEKYPQQVNRGLMLQGLGNELIELFGARSVHPVGVKVGGFFKPPTARSIVKILRKLRDALAPAEELIRWTASLPIPDDQQKFTSVALRSDDGYAICHGNIVSSDGLNIGIEEFDNYFTETHQPNSTALYSELNHQPYLVGPLARLNLNLDQLPAPVAKAVEKTGIQFPSQNMFHSLVARAVEIQLALLEAIQVLENYAAKDNNSPADYQPRSGISYGCSEAPRGLLWHRYEFDELGKVTTARIVPPTSQNQARIEEDLHNSLMQFGLDNSDKALRLHSEMVIRNYDPCISCATHFLNLNICR